MKKKWFKYIVFIVGVLLLTLFVLEVLTVGSFHNHPGAVKVSILKQQK